MQLSRFWESKFISQFYFFGHVRKVKWDNCRKIHRRYNKCKGVEKLAILSLLSEAIPDNISILLLDFCMLFSVHSVMLRYHLLHA